MAISTLLKTGGMTEVTVDVPDSPSAVSQMSSGGVPGGAGGEGDPTPIPTGGTSVPVPGGNPPVSYDPNWEWVVADDGTLVLKPKANPPDSGYVVVDVPPGL